MATIKLNGRDATLNPIQGTQKNDKLTASGSSNDELQAFLLGGKDLVELTAEDEFDDEATNDMTVNGGDGKDKIEAVDGLLTVEGKLNGADGNDKIYVARADGAELQGGQDADILDLGSSVELNVAGSNAVATIQDSQAFGGKGDDTVRTLEFAEVTDSFVSGEKGHDTMSIDGSIVGSTEVIKAVDGSGNEVISSSSYVNGGAGRDTIGIEDGATIVNTVINGNANADHIVVGSNGRGVLDTEGSAIVGGKGNDTIEAALAGAMSVEGGKGKDVLRIGSGQTVTGGEGVDLFSVEAEGGVTIMDYNAEGDKEDCYCSDVIQVDGNKLNYTSKAYEHTVAVNTTKSSYTGVIKVKAVAEAVQDTANCDVPFDGIKIEGLTATAVAFGYATQPGARFNLENTVNKPEFDINYPSLGFVNKDANGDGFGSRNNLVVPNGMEGVSGAEYLGPFGTIQSRLAGSGLSAASLEADLKGIGFGYAQAKGVINNDPGDDFVASFVNDIVATTYTSFRAGQFSFLGLSRSCEVSAKVQQMLTFNDVSNATIKNHSAVYGVAKETDTKELYTMKLGTTNFTEITVGTAYMKVTKGIEDNTYLKTSKTLNGGILADTSAGTGNALLTLNGEFSFKVVTKSAEITDNGIVDKNGIPFINPWNVVTGGFNSSNAAWQEAKRLTVNATIPAQIDGPPQANLFDTRTDFATRYLAVKVADTGNATVNAFLPTFVERRTFGPTVLDLDSCPEFPTPGELANKQGSNHGSVVLSNSAKSLLWTGDEGGVSIASVLNNSQINSGAKIFNGESIGNAYFSSVLAKNCNISTSCTGENSYIAPVAGKSNQTTNVVNASILKNLGTGAFFSASDWNVAALAAAGMGDGLSSGQDDAQGAPFRVLFFDTEGTDKGLYMYSGLANYKDGDVTAIANTEGTTSSAMGGKHTIVKVNGGKGFEDFALSDIQLV